MLSVNYFDFSYLHPLLFLAIAFFNTLSLLSFSSCVIPGRIIFMVVRFMYTSLTRRYFTFFNHLCSARVYIFNINNMVNIFVSARLMVDFGTFLTNLFTFQ